MTRGANMFRTILLLALFISCSSAVFHPGSCGEDSCDHGECITTGGHHGASKHWCLCRDGYTGPRCSTPPCPNVCWNGGNCSRTDDDYLCSCPLGFEGRYCEKETPSVCSTAKPCGDNGNCVLTRSLDDYTCHCKRGFSGTNCSIAETCPVGYCVHGSCAPDDTCVCPQNYRGMRCDEDVDECAADENPCLHGTCQNTVGSFFCECDSGFMGERCEFEEKLIEANCTMDGRVICRNGGVCRLDKNTIPGCICPPTYQGAHCELDVDECANPLSCSGRGHCINSWGGYKCICDGGYGGDQCEKKTNYCVHNPCLNHGVCMNHGDNFICRCPPGHVGRLCEQFDPCIYEKPCHNGKCQSIMATGDFQCECSEGFEGAFCEKDIDECALGNTCFNSGQCVNMDGGFRCECKRPFGGKHCDEIVPLCQKDTCANGGLCIEKNDRFVCACPPGLQGERCELPLNECPNLVCYNGGNCTNGVCHCPQGVHGKLCELAIPKKTEKCHTNPCLHGRCVEVGGDYRCECRSGYIGRNCEENIDDCRPGLCLSGGYCIDGEDSYTCACRRGFNGKHCEHEIDLDHFNETLRKDQLRCQKMQCQAVAGNGVCNQECNHFACGFDGGDCSAKALPYEKCPQAAFCSRAFRDGTCDSMCNSEECLFDGFDCDGSNSTCQIADHCLKRFNNGFCDTECNNSACGYDGGDCEKAVEATLSGHVVMVLEVSPEEFLPRLNSFLMLLSADLRSEVRLRQDAEGPMVFRWRNGEQKDRIPVSRDQALSVRFVPTSPRQRRSLLAESPGRVKREDAQEGVLVWLTVDVTNCEKDCFSNIDTVVSFLGRAAAKKDLDKLGLKVLEVQARVAEPPTVDPSSGLLFYIGGVACFAILALVTMKIVTANKERTRKRRMIRATTWFPPTDQQYKMMQAQQAEYNRQQSIQNSMQSLYSACGSDMYSIKRSRLDNPPMPNYAAFNGPYQVPVPQVFNKPLPKMVYPEYSPLHEAAMSEELIPLPIEKTVVNARHGPGGWTPLLLLVKNNKKSMDKIRIDMDNLFKAGAFVDVQDEEEETPLFYCARAGKVELVRQLIEMAADPTKMNINDSTPLHQAAHNGHVAMAKELLKHDKVKKEINEVDKNGRTALMICALYDPLSTAVARLIVEAGADPSFQGDKGSLTYKGRTALHYAAQCDNIKMMHFLLEKEVNKDAQDFEDATPLLLAVKAGSKKAVEVLVEAGASIEISDQTDCSPISVARDENMEDILEILETKKAADMCIPIPDNKPRVATTARAIKRTAQKRRAGQTHPLTPPHSDGTSTPPDNFQTNKPLLNSTNTTLDSPHSESNASNKTASPNYPNPLGASSFVQCSPPYGERYPEWSNGAMNQLEAQMSLGSQLPPAMDRTLFFPQYMQNTFTSDYHSANTTFDTTSGSSYHQLGAEPTHPNGWN